MKGGNPFAILGHCDSVARDAARTDFLIGTGKIVKGYPAIDRF
jgi:hypothetical protein